MFRFKQFTIVQDQCAMKVGTDSVLLGSWTSLPQTGRALDIGTGTGLLSLMIAQRSSSLQIDALEIDTQAAEQAHYNVEQSPWSNRIRIIPESIQDYYPTHQQEKYDFIISNPPFFQSGGLIEKKERRFARHNDTLSFKELFSYAHRLLSEQGRLSIVVPYDAYQTIQEIASEHKLFIERINFIYPNQKAFNEEKPKRLLMTFSFINQTTKTEKLIIEPEKRHFYSEEYKSLVEPFYLYFKE